MLGAGSTTPVVGHARANLDDLLARQVLGDWLHGQGDAYGALVGRWLATPHGPGRTRLGLEAHRALFDGWTDDEVAARWDHGFLTELGLYVAHGRSETLTKKIPALLQHPATWLLRRIAICSLPGEPLVGDEAVGEREALWTIVGAVAQAGPHPTVRRLEITCKSGETFDIFELARSLPGLTELVVPRALGPMWPFPRRWPGSVRLHGHGCGWDTHVGLELDAGALSALVAFEGGGARRPSLDELGGIRQVPVRPDGARPLEPRRLHFDGELFDLGAPEPIERLEGWLDPDGYLADDDEVGIDLDQEPQQSPHEWLELVPEGTVDAWGDDDEIFNDPWDVGEPTHVDV